MNLDGPTWRRRWTVAAGLLAIIAMSAPAFAQSSNVDAGGLPGVGNATSRQLVAATTFISELVPLSANQLQNEAGKGVPGGVSAGVVPKPSSGTIRLWDEVPTMRVVPTQATETLTITLNR